MAKDRSSSKPPDEGDGARQVQIFDFKGHNVRSMIEGDGETLFLGKDIARRAGYKITEKAIRTHCKRAVTYPSILDGQVRYAKWIPESDVYRLLAHSHLPEAVEFEKWIFEEVLPSIRKTGGYRPDGFSSEEKTAILRGLEEMQRLSLDLLRRQAEIDANAQVMQVEIDRLSSAREVAAAQPAKEVPPGYFRLVSWARGHGIIIPGRYQNSEGKRATAIHKKMMKDEPLYAKPLGQGRPANYYPRAVLRAWLKEWLLANPLYRSMTLFDRFD